MQKKDTESLQGREGKQIKRSENDRVQTILESREHIIYVGIRKKGNPDQQIQNKKEKKQDFRTTANYSRA